MTRKSWREIEAAVEELAAGTGPDTLVIEETTVGTEAVDGGPEPGETETETREVVLS